MRRLSVFVCVLAFAVVAFLFEGISFAGPDSVQKSIENQRAAISYAVRHGKLSRNDAATLQSNLDKIQKKLAEYVDEDRLTHKHEKKLKKRLNENMELFNSMTSRRPSRKSN